jgi:hypothetical protein
LALASRADQTSPINDLRDEFRFPADGVGLMNYSPMWDIHLLQ